MADPSPQWLRGRFRLLLLFLLLGYSVMSLLSFSLVVYLRRHRRSAFAGDPQAARRVILPTFEPLLIVLAATTLLYSIYIATALSLELYAFKFSRLAIEVFYSGRQFVLLSVVLCMLQAGVSHAALWRALLQTLLLATYTVPVVALLVAYGASDHQFYVLLTSARALLLLLYLRVFVKPPRRASKRTLREFCVYASVYYALLFAYNELFRRDQADAGFLLTYANLVWGSLCPLVIWRVLKADTDYWRSLGQRAVVLQQGLASSASSSSSSSSTTATSSLYAPLASSSTTATTTTMGMALRSHLLPAECISSRGRYVLIEMQRKYIVDFAYLELKRRIGTGGSAVVFRGMLRGTRHVAVKVYTPQRLDELTVAQFAQEAALCGTLRHPNVVEFVGLCVNPPTICLVSELCMGTLDDVLQARARRDSNANMHGSNSNVLTPPIKSSPRLLDLCYMVDAARAVAYLHSFTPPFLHRDIKPANFLIDGNNTVKLTDFGASRSLPRAAMKPRTRPPRQRRRKRPTATTATANCDTPAMLHTPSNKTSATFKQLQLQLDQEQEEEQEQQVLGATMRTDVDAAEYESHRPSLLSVHSMTSSIASCDWLPSPSSAADRSPSRRLMTIKGTVEYMAPELLRGHGGQACYGEAADVYALAITLWDILYPGYEKYPFGSGNPLTIIDGVLAGQRPPLSPMEIHPVMEELLTSAWHEDAQRRPSAQCVVEVLESLQQELSAPLADRLYGQLEVHRLLRRDLRDESGGGGGGGDESGARVMVAGKSLVEMLRVDQAVETEREAVRLGNALIDAGMVHHSSHSRPLDVTNPEEEEEEEEEEAYYFDLGRIRRVARGEDTSEERTKSVAVSVGPPLPPPPLPTNRSNRGRSSRRTRSSSKRAPSDPPVKLPSDTGTCACRKLSQRLRLPVPRDAGYGNGSNGSSGDGEQKRQKRSQLNKECVLTMNDPLETTTLQTAEEWDEMAATQKKREEDEAAEEEGTEERLSQWTSFHLTPSFHLTLAAHGHGRPEEEIEETEDDEERHQQRLCRSKEDCGYQIV